MRTKILFCSQYDTFPVWLPTDYGTLGNTAYSTVRSRGHKTCTVSYYLPAAMIDHWDHRKPESCHNLHLWDQPGSNLFSLFVQLLPNTLIIHITWYSSVAKVIASVIASLMLELKYTGNKMFIILALTCLATFHSKCRFSLKIFYFWNSSFSMCISDS